MANKDICFNKQLLKDSFKGNEELLVELVIEFIKQVPEHIQTLETSFANKNYEQLELTSHTLKGIAAHFQCHAAKKSAYVIELIAKSKVEPKMQNINCLIKKIQHLSLDLEQVYIVTHGDNA